MADSRTIKIFLASPSDVESERDALSSLIREINDVLAFLVPDRALRLELLRYETHTYPDMGQAQEVINRQITAEYDIFIGVMWKRCGTPTATSQSGTVEEFQRALLRRERTGGPIIMFYFCEEPVPFPRAEDMEQLLKVVRFKDELTEKGYTLSYPSHAEFRDHVRGGLLRAVADLLNKQQASSPSPEENSPEPMAPSEDREAVSRLAADYDEIRRSMPSGDARTKRLADVTAAIRLHAAAVKYLLPDYKKSNSAGLRLAAICVLQQFPTAAELPWLAERLDPERERPFIGYEAAVALVQAVRSLSGHQTEIKDAIEQALLLGQRNPHDQSRINVLRTALNELAAKANAAAA